jgi:virginiamycin B lyase
MKSQLQRLALAAAAACLAACGGGGNSSPVPSAAGATPTASPATAAPSATPAPAATPTQPAVTQTFTLTVPRATAGAARTRRPFYVSANTGSIRIAVQSVNGVASNVATTIARTAPGAPGCKTSPGGLACSIVAAAAIGADVFSIATYASLDASGTPLATTTVSAQIANASPPPIALSPEGVPATLSFSPSVLPLVDDGAIHRYALTIAAFDASGAPITGGSPYQSPVSLQIQNDPTHALSLSTASVAQPGTVVTLTFDGSRALAAGAIVASETGFAPVTLAAAPLQFSPPSLFAYDDQSGGVAETIFQSGFTGTFTAALANPQDGRVVQSGGALGAGSAVASVIPTTRFDVTSLRVGNGSYAGTVPVTIVPHPGTYAASGPAHRLGTPSGLALGPRGLLWTADAQNGALTSFDPSTGSYASYVVDPTQSGPTSLAFDARGLLWFADRSTIGSFDTSTHALVTYSKGLLSDARVLSIVAGPAGTMWFYDEESNNVPTFVGGPTAFGTIATATGAIHEYPTPDAAVPAVAFESMTLGPDGALWYADGSDGAIGRVTTAGSYSRVRVAETDSPNFAPDVVLAAPDGNIWFAGDNAGLAQAFIGTVNPATHAVAEYPAGTGAAQFDALVAGSGGDLWFAAQPAQGTFFSSQAEIGIVNTATHANYAYPAILPQFAVPANLVDRGKTLYVLDDAFGEIGKVSFK